jgi:hypothetical protein
MSQAIDVTCAPAADGWRCQVTVGDDPGATVHDVAVSESTLERLATGAEGPEALVRASFEFLLAREGRESILRTFDLQVIRRYFPDWVQEIQRTLSS